MSRKTNDRKSKIKLISDTMTGFYSVMRNLKEDYKTYSKTIPKKPLHFSASQMISLSPWKPCEAATASAA